MNKGTRLSVMRLPGTSTLIIRQEGEKRFFVSSNNSLVIDVTNLLTLIKVLIVNGLMSRKVLEGLLSELTD